MLLFVKDESDYPDLCTDLMYCHGGNNLWNAWNLRIFHWTESAAVNTGIAVDTGLHRRHMPLS